MHGNPVLGGDSGNLGDGLHGTHLVIGPHDGHERDVLGVLLDELADRLRVHAAAFVHWNPFDVRALGLFKPLAGVFHGVVFDGGDENSGTPSVFLAALPVDALYGEVVRLGAARGENNLGGVGANGAGYAFAGVLDGGSGVSAQGVQ